MLPNGLEPFDWIILTLVLLLFVVLVGIYRRLVDHQSRWESLLQLSPDAIFITKGRVIEYTNDEGLSLLHASAPEQLIGRETREFFRPEDQDRLDRELVRNRDGRRSHLVFNVELRRLDGSTLLGQVAARRVHVGEGTHAIIVVRDVTEQVHTARMLRERVEFQTVVNTVSSLLLRRPAEEIPEGVRAALRQVGEFSGAGLAWLAGLNPDSRLWTANYAWSAEPARSVDDSIDLVRRIPEVTRQLAQLEPVSIPSVKDLAGLYGGDRARLEQLGIQSVLLVPLVSQRQLSGVIGLASAMAERNWSPALAALLQIVGDLSMSALALHDAQAEALGYGEALEALVRARTSRIEELERQRLEGEKLAATGRMSARIAHEINNPLAGIKNSFRLVREAIDPHHPHRSYVDRIDREIDRIARIVRQMYDIYRPEREQPREFLLRETLQDVALLLEPVAGRRNVVVQVQTIPSSLKVNLPEGAVRQVLFNLVANAIEASPNSGTILATARLQTGQVQIEVCDQGSGIPNWAQERVFEPFFTTKHSHDGSGLGLGLSVSRGLAESMGGSLAFVSEPGRGTTFRLAVPLGAASQLRRETEARPE